MTCSHRAEPEPVASEVSAPARRSTRAPKRTFSCRYEFPKNFSCRPDERDLYRRESRTKTLALALCEGRFVCSDEEKISSWSTSRVSLTTRQDVLYEAPQLGFEPWRKTNVSPDSEAAICGRNLLGRCLLPSRTSMEDVAWLMTSLLCGHQ